MSQNENMQRLNTITSTVNERDMKIWEDVAYSICIQKQTENLENEIKKLKGGTAEKKKENQMIEAQLVKLTQTLAVQRETLRSSEKSLVMQKNYKDSLLQEAKDLQKKYSETLAMYNDELQEYRGIYENASQNYQNLKILRVEMKKLEVKKMILDETIKNLERNQEEYMKIQKQRFYKAVVRYAEFYVLYHKREKIRQEVQEKKKEEQQLLKEHLKLSEAVKQKKTLKRKSPINENSVSKDGDLRKQADVSSKESKEVDVEKFQKFLNEDIQPCSLTSFSSTQKAATFNQDNSKVKILEMKVIKPPIQTVKKPNLELRKHMESIMQAAKKEARRSNSFHVSNLNLKHFDNPKKNPTPSSPQPKEQQKNETEAEEPQIKAALLNNSQERTKTASQESKNEEKGLMSSQEKKLSKIKAASDLPAAAGSILKMPVNFDKQEVTKSENVSKFFNPKKKSVTFQNELKRNSQERNSRFQLFSMEEKKSNSETRVKDMDIFQKSFFFKSQRLQKKELPSETETEPSDGNNSTSFAIDTVPTTFSSGTPTFMGNYCAESSQKKNELSFEVPKTSFNHTFGQPPANPSENFTADVETTTFDFFGSQIKPNNPFNFL